MQLRVSRRDDESSVVAQLSTEQVGASDRFLPTLPTAPYTVNRHIRDLSNQTHRYLIASDYPLSSMLLIDIRVQTSWIALATTKMLGINKQ